MKLSPAFGSAIRAWRRSADLTQKQCSQSSGIDLSFWARVERGRQAASLEFIERMAKEIGCPLHVLLRMASECLIMCADAATADQVPPVVAVSVGAPGSVGAEPVLSSAVASSSPKPPGGELVADRPNGGVL